MMSSIATAAGAGGMLSGIKSIAELGAQGVLALSVTGFFLLGFYFLKNSLPLILSTGREMATANVTTSQNNMRSSEMVAAAATSVSQSLRDLSQAEQERHEHLLEKVKALRPCEARDVAREQESKRQGG